METWKPIPDYEEFYEINDLGKIRSIDRQVWVVHGTKGGRWKPVRSRIRKTTINPKNGYEYVSLNKDGSQKLFSVHRLVLVAFLGSDDGQDAMHLDNDRTNNSLSNLRWGSRSENIQQCWDEGRRDYAGCCVPR